MNEGVPNEGVLHVVLTLFALFFPLFLTPVYNRYRRLRFNYLTPGETPASWDPTAQAFYEFNALVFVVPVLIALSILLPRPLPALSHWALPLILFSLFQYILMAVLAEYYKLYALSKKGFSTAKVAVPVLLVFSFILIILVPVMATMSAFTSDAWNAKACGLIVFWPLTVYTILSVFCIIIPLELDARFIGKQMLDSVLLGEALIYVDSIVHLATTNSSRLQAIADHLEFRFAASLPSKRKKRTRLLEFVVYTSQQRQDLAEIMTLERCRRAVVARERVIAQRQKDYGFEEVYLDVGGIRGRKVACIVCPRDPEYNDPPAVRCLDVGDIKNVHTAGMNSAIPHSLGSKQAQQFWDDACAAEADFLSRH